LMTENLEIVGIPRVTLQTTADAPAANWLVRLSDVAPNGMVTHVTGAGFNANHVESSEQPIQLVKDKVYTLEIDLHATSWTFEKGHRIRLSVNNAQWPMIWPSPYNMTTTVRSDDDSRSFLKLPVLTDPTPLAKPFSKPGANPRLADYKSIASETPSGYPETKKVVRNERTGSTTIYATNSGSYQYPWGVHRWKESITSRLSDDAPANASVQSAHELSVELENRVLTWRSVLDFTSDERTFFYRYKRTLEEDGKVIREKEWTEDIPRAW